MPVRLHKPHPSRGNQMIQAAFQVLFQGRATCTANSELLKVGLLFSCGHNSNKFSQKTLCVLARNGQMIEQF